MKKSVIALAVAAALPVAAQADMTLSGSVEAAYVVNAKGLDIDSDLDIASTEVLANGMTAAVSFDVGDEGDSGEASLEGDFGTLTAGSGLDKDGTFQSGVLVAGTTATLWEKSTSASTANAIHYTGSWAGLSIQAQVNAGTDASGATTKTTVATTGGTAANSATGAAAVVGTGSVTTVTDTSQPSATQLAATYDFNGIKLGYAMVDADMTSATKDAAGNKITIKKGNAITATYSFGDLSVGYGKANTAKDAVMMVGYEATYGEVALTASVYDWGSTTSTYGSATYTLDGLTVAVAYDSDKGASGSKGISAGKKASTVTATYVSGDMTAEICTQFDGTTDYSVALDLGNADLSLKRDGSDSKTTAKYTVAF